MAIQSKYAYLMTMLLVIFCFRVAAQLLQFFSPTEYLPAFSSWQGGSQPYWVLVVFQFIVIFLCLRVIFKFLRTKVNASPKRGKVFLYIGGFYFLSMFLRLIIGFTVATEHSWFGATIPAFFHLVLATFLITYSYYHYKYGRVSL